MKETGILNLTLVIVAVLFGLTGTTTRVGLDLSQKGPIEGMPFSF